MCFKKIKALFHRGETKLAPEKPLGRKPKIKEPERRILTGRGGPNMPKYQPCPSCGTWVKRESKTMGGANYYHNKHGSFFVKAS